MHLGDRSTGRSQGPLAKVGLSAKFGVAVFKASMLDSLGGGSISQSRFICQVWCSHIQGILFLITQARRVHLPKYVHLPSFVYWCSRQISPVRVEISYCHLQGGVSGVFWACFGVSRGVLRGVTSDITLQCQLTVYYPNYSEIRGNSHLFLKNPKWLQNLSHHIYA